jgi:TonB family protein
MRSRSARGLLPLLLLLAGGCGIDTETTAKAIESIITPPKPDTAPVMLNAQPPFRYPPSLYDRKVQGNVVLRLFIDSTGRVWPESTLVTESSGFPALDTAAIQGSDVLRFKPAIKDGAPMNVRVAFPVYFRHPEARALPGDTVLKSGNRQ